MTKTSRLLSKAALFGLVVAVAAAPSPAFADTHNVSKEAPKDASGPAQDTQTQDAQAQDTQADVRLRLPPAAITHHTLEQDGKSIPYSAVAGAIEPRDEDGRPIAEIFYVAYAAEPEALSRPITFVFNGGPGAASTYLHLGAIGPKVVETEESGALIGPPPRLVANDASWLDFTDLVFVDPVGTGYSRATGSKTDKDFWGVEQDADSLAEFIRLYLTQNGRMGFPVFMAGESYGGFRAAAITRTLQKTSGVSPSGLVLVSPALEFSLLRRDDFYPLPWALSLPSYAAVKLESEGITMRDALTEELKDVELYALTDYLVALASGIREGGRKASPQVAELTGLPLEKVRQYFARIPPSLFIKEFDREGGRLLSRYDGSIGGPDPNPSSAGPRGPDPVLDATAPLWTSAFVRYAQEDLAYKTDENFQLLNRDVSGTWDYGTSPTRQGYAGVLDDIQNARAANRALEVMIASGYTDLVTPYMVPVYLVKQLPSLTGANPITIENYAGGHMLYLRPDSRRALKKDVESMYRRALSSTATQG